MDDSRKCPCPPTTVGIYTFNPFLLLEIPKCSTPIISLAPLSEFCLSFLHPLGISCLSPWWNSTGDIHSTNVTNGRTLQFYPESLFPFDPSQRLRNTKNTTETASTWIWWALLFISKVKFPYGNQLVGKVWLKIYVQLYFGGMTLRTGEGKRRNELAECHMAWLAEWHNYAEYNSWKMAQEIN